MILFLFIILLSYFGFTLALALTWRAMPSASSDPGFGSEPDRQPKISVIIPVRNEEHTLPLLLADLAGQTYPANLFEVIVADDSSTDRTRAVARDLARSVPYALTVLPLADERTASPKKRAISQSITVAGGELITTTDGDCRVGPRWLAGLAGFYRQSGAKLISGPVTFTNEQSPFDYLQTVEGSSLIGSGACTIGWGKPTMCNGANLTYPKAVFEEVGGFSGIDHLASGDDELLMHKIAEKYPKGVRFLKMADVTVRTAPQPSLKAFYAQRKRWASKWKAYRTILPSLLAIFIFVSNMAVPLAVFSFFSGALTGGQLLGLLSLKWTPEWVFLGSVLRFLKKKKAIPWILPTQLLYPFYVLFFGLAAQRKGFQWKGRELT